MKSEDFGQTHSADLSIQHVTAVKINSKEERRRLKTIIGFPLKDKTRSIWSDPENSFVQYHVVVESRRTRVTLSVAWRYI